MPSFFIQNEESRVLPTAPKQARLPPARGRGQCHPRGFPEYPSRHPSLTLGSRNPGLREASRLPKGAKRRRIWDSCKTQLFHSTMSSPLMESQKTGSGDEPRTHHQLCSQGRLLQGPHSPTFPLPSPQKTQRCHTGVYSSHSFQRNSTINYIIK